MNSFDRYTKEQAARRTTANFIYLIAMAIDIVLVFLLKDKSGWFRWLWLPLISAALAFICDRARNWSYQPSHVGTLLMIWGFARGLIVVVAYFKALSGFAIIGAIFLCIFMCMANLLAFCCVGAEIKPDPKSKPDAPKATPTPASSGASAGRVSGKPVSPTPTVSATPKRVTGKPTNYTPKYEEKKPSAPRRGDPEKYFSSYACAPQSGSMYFWSSAPSMRSSFGHHSTYDVTATIGIRKQSVEAFHVTSTDMDHHLNSVKQDIERYVDGIIRDYRRDYPEDDTDFKVYVDVTLEII